MTPHICPVCYSTSVVTRAPTWSKVILLFGIFIWPLLLIGIICAIFIRPPTCRSCNARAIPAATPHGRQLVEQHEIQLPPVAPAPVGRFVFTVLGCVVAVGLLLGGIAALLLVTS